MKTITVSGKTYDEAITNALIELQTTSDHLEVEVIEKGTNGLFGVFGGKPYTIKASIKEESNDLDNSHSDIDINNNEDSISIDALDKVLKAEKEVVCDNIKSEKDSIDAEECMDTNFEDADEDISENISSISSQRDSSISKDEMEALCSKANAFLKDIFSTMEMQVQIDCDYDLSENEISINLEGDDMGILIGKRGQTLDSLQYLVSLVVNKHLDGYVRVKIDTENYRERRKEKLEVLAKNIARKVKRTRTAVTLEPMNPYERRIIHSALQHDQYVTTKSEGEDPYRHIVVVLKNGYKKPNQRKNRNYDSK